MEEKAEIYKAFRIQKEMEAESKQKGGKGKKPDSAKNKKTVSTKDKVSVDHKDFDNKDLYNAEKELWRFVQPNEISTKFICLVTFPDLKHK